MFSVVCSGTKAVARIALSGAIAKFFPPGRAKSDRKTGASENPATRQSGEDPPNGRFSERLPATEIVSLLGGTMVAQSGCGNRLTGRTGDAEDTLSRKM